MLQTINLVKEYYTGGQIIKALRGVSITFRDNEFVSILGPSGCGKTTFLNIIGGLDNYTSGDLVINGRSTKDYTDKDWDVYRNHRVGFVFQSYNLIMHQTVLQNVELSMTLTGVPKEERRKRAQAALEKVGLGDQLNKKPTQMSGGQMQRVAIARALVNDPEIVLADEPTGALDSVTSVQIMELLKEIAKDRLVIMVTHNPELAEAYSTRIVRLKDGEVVSDTNPVTGQDKEQAQEKLSKPSMRFLTALSLSFNNLLTKKGRTFLTAVAGSIGIIGIGLIMSISNGMQNYIDRVENDTMTSYPITIEDNSMDMSVMLSAMMNLNKKDQEAPNPDKITSRQFSNTVLEGMANTEENNLTAFKAFLESPEGKELRDTASAIEYDYGLTMHVYNTHSEYGTIKVSPNGMLEAIGMDDMIKLRDQFMGSSAASGMGNEVWLPLPADDKLREEDYELTDGKWPEKADEVILLADGNNQVTDYTLYSLGLMDQSELIKNFKDFQNGKAKEITPGQPVTLYKKDLLGMEFTVVPDAAMYQKTNGIWVDMSGDEDYVDQAIQKDGFQVKVVGIMKPKANSLGTSSTTGGIYYPAALQDKLMKLADESAPVKEQKENPDMNIFTGRDFDDDSQFSMKDLSMEEQMALAGMSQSELMSYMNSYNANANASYAANLTKLGAIDLKTPTGISIYADTFEDKEKIGDLISGYNEVQEANGDSANIISYNDVVGTMMSGVSDIINIISYVLMAFVSVSLVVSSIMIGIITYISVLERVKEIGILRAMGASKRDITRVFNAETFIIGLFSGLLGVGVTCLLDIPISLIVQQKTGVPDIASMPWDGALALILIELVLTMLAGLIPARMAARKDPVEALRSE